MRIPTREEIDRIMERALEKAEAEIEWLYEPFKLFHSDKVRDETVKELAIQIVNENDVTQIVNALKDMFSSQDGHRVIIDLADLILAMNNFKLREKEIRKQDAMRR